MKKTQKLFAAIVAVLLVVSLFGFLPPAAPAGAEAVAVKSSSSSRDPHEIVNVIVKLEDAPVLENAARGSEKADLGSRALREKQTAVSNEIAEKLNGGQQLDVLYNYTLLFNGFAFRGEYRLINEIKKLKGVANCYESWTYAAPETIESGEDTRLGTSVGWIGAPELWALGCTGAGQTIAVIDTGIMKEHPAFAAAPANPHFDAAALDEVLASAELCAEQRYTGGTLTGQDLYYSAKIPYTFNYFAGNTDVSHSWAMNDHGTHVSSIAAGNSSGARGVAYDAQILSMQIFNGGNADWVDIMAALEDCSYLGVDTVNMSLGADCGFTHDDDIEPFYALLAESGVNVAVSSGNSGTAGGGNLFNGTTPTFNVDNGTTGTPGTIPGSMSVAASDNDSYGFPTYYSGWGTTSDLRIKPELMAPGNNIEAATDPEYSGSSYDIKSGTSMAAPHIAGSMALVSQYVKANFPELTPTERMQLVDTLLMCTAVPKTNEGVPFSPRQQGAGLADLAAAISTRAYIEVPGSIRPKLELGDDDEKSGVFSFEFDVVNFGAEPLSYTLRPYVLTERTNMWLVGYQLVTIMDHASEDITTFVDVTAPASITVPAGGRTTVSVTIDLGSHAAVLDESFPMGVYIDGFITLDGEVDLSVPYLGFYGDWEYSAVFDRKNYYDQYQGGSPLAFPNEWGTNRAATENAGTTVLFGMNPLASTNSFLLDRSSLSPNGDGRMDEITLIHTYMLRNAETFRYEVVDADTGEQYFVQDVKFVPKAVANSYTSFYQPVGAEDWTRMESWGGEGLANGTHCILRMTGFMQSFDEFDPAANENAVWEVPITIDTEAPTAESFSLSEGTLDIAVSDNHYVSMVGVYANAACTSVIEERAVEEPQRGMTSNLSFAVGARDKVYVRVYDYACNAITLEISAGSAFLPGDCDLNGEVDIADAVLALRHSMGILTLQGDAFLAGDVDGDGEVSVADALMIMRYAMGLLPEL